MSYPFKICDPIHGFIRFGSFEQAVIDSAAFQRLRYIHQMGTAYLIYPGATHKRFEHSLGVMELVTRIYNTLIQPHHQIVKLAPEELDYWLLILRLAALCHDLGHLPFSHTAEKSLLPDGGHEGMTLALIHSPELKAIWKEIGSSAEADIVKLAVAPEIDLTPWERVLSQIITEDNFGADRIDYLIRDGRYTGVGYSFDDHQLIDCLRILPVGDSLSLGISADGIQSVEALWIARYMMYARVYHHSKARVYSNHMHRFMQRHYSGKISTDPGSYLRHTDYTVLTALAEAGAAGDYHAQCLLKRERAFVEVPLKAASKEVLEALKEVFGEDIFIEQFPKKAASRSFPVLTDEGKILSSLEASPFLREIPSGGKSVCICIHPDREDELITWIAKQEHLVSV